MNRLASRFAAVLVAAGFAAFSPAQETKPAPGNKPAGEKPASQPKAPRPPRFQPEQFAGMADRIANLPGITEEQRRKCREVIREIVREANEAEKAPAREGIVAIVRTRLENVMTERQRVLLTRIGDGQLSESRFGHALILDLPTLAPERRALFEKLIAGAEGAESALFMVEEAERRARDAWQKAQTALVAKEGTPQPPAVAGAPMPEPPIPLAPPVNQRRQTLNERFWTVASELLTAEEMAKVNSELPHQERRFQDMYRKSELIPGLTASQMQQTQSRVEQIESESTADRAEIDRLRRALRGKDISQDERRSIIEEISAADARLRAISARVYSDFLAIFNPQQRLAFEALPLTVRPGATGRFEPTEFARIQLTPDQRKTVEDLMKPIRDEAEAAKKRPRPKPRIEGEMPEGSPDAPMMQAPGIQQRARMFSIQQECFHRIVTEVLTPPQLVDLILLSIAEPERKPEPPKPEPPKAEPPKPAAPAASRPASRPAAPK